MVYAGSIAFVALFPDLFLAAFRNVICLKERCDLIGKKNRNIQPQVWYRITTLVLPLLFATLVPLHL
jgi:hypothetical protein